VSEEKLATVLRTFLTTKGAYLQARSAMEDATEMREMEIAAYLRGYDDAKAEADPYIAQLERENEALEARVNDLESMVEKLDSQPQPAAVGVVGVVRWAVIDRFYDLDGTITYKSRESAEFRAGQMHKSLDARVVAIVDPAQIVPLASGTPARWMSVSGHTGMDMLNGDTPLYPGHAHYRFSDNTTLGMAQPAQECDA